MTYQVEITQEDIKKGERNHWCKCAAALAIQRATGAKETYVWRSSGAFTRDTRDVWQILAKGEQYAGLVFFVLPIEVQEWVRNFDLRKHTDPKPEPLTFQLITEEPEG